MALLNLLYYPDERLHQVSKPVTEFNQNLKRLVADMYETMYTDEGIGLAAPQINVFERIVVIDVVGDKSPEHQLTIINPVFISQSGETGIEEGCLSVPELRAHITRFEHVVVKAQNIKGEFFQIEASDLLAICLQHEIDHLNGKLFIDYLSPLKKNLYRTKALKLAKQRKKALEN
jgi:peptide deformylase